MVNKKKINQAIKISGYKKEYLAREMGISKQAFSNKINGNTEFKASELFYLVGKLHIRTEDIEEVFFGKKANEK